MIAALLIAAAFAVCMAVVNIVLVVANDDLRETNSVLIEQLRRHEIRPTPGVRVIEGIETR